MSKKAKDKKDKPVRIEDLPYRRCIGIALFNRDGLVWVGRRSHVTGDAEGVDSWWQMPQGGIDEGEDHAKAALRELYEETSIKKTSLIREAPGWLTYDLPRELVPTSWGGRYRGQKQKWVALRFEGKDSDIDVLHPGGGKHKAEFSEWRWEKLSRLPELVVPFKRHVYEAVVAAFSDIAA
jgi:putative (di)nucleoside polyphosphate hydrolase